MTPPPEPSPEPLDADRLTWAVLLGRWTDFARSAVALPDDAAGRRLRASVADLIGLQAVWFALSQMRELPPGAMAPDERALGLTRAGVLIDRHAQALETRFAPEPLPEQARELIADAREAHALARAGARPSADAGDSH